jgi:hypothetical protein
MPKAAEAKRKKKIVGLVRGGANINFARASTKTLQIMVNQAPSAHVKRQARLELRKRATAGSRGPLTKAKKKVKRKA